MRRILNQCPRISAGELPGILLVMLGAVALGFYYSWWFMEDRLSSPWLGLGLAVAIGYTGVQLLGNWLIYLAAPYRSGPPYPSSNENPTVDVFITAYQEEPALIERALAAVCAMPGNHRIWLLDDGQDPALAHLARRLGVGYLTRTNREHAKAGNINAALAQTDGDIIVIFDIDHAPKPNFLERTLPYFEDAEIGFVQVMLTFENGTGSWVAQAAAESSLDFYNPVAIGTDGLNSATLIGSNALIRRKALASIGGYQPGLAEDLATSIALHAAGWRSVYVPEPLAPGYAPPDLAAWFTQQMKWARGVFELLLTAYPRYFPRLNLGQRIAYAVRMTYYWIGPVTCIHLLATLGLLFSANHDALASFQQYLIHLLPLGSMAVIIRQFALHKWHHPSLKPTLQGKPLMLVYATWPIYTLAWLMTILRLPLTFRPTPKRSSGRLNPVWLLPQAVTLLSLVGGVFYTFTVVEGYFYVLLFCFAAGQSIPQADLLRQFLYPNLISKKREIFSHQVISHKVIYKKRRF